MADVRCADCVYFKQWPAPNSTWGGCGNERSHAHQWLMHESDGCARGRAASLELVAARDVVRKEAAR